MRQHAEEHVDCVDNRRPHDCGCDDHNDRDLHRSRKSLRRPERVQDQAAVSTVAPGRVDFAVTNDGKIKHQFTIIRTDKPASTVLSKQNPDDDIPGARGEISSLAPGTTKQLVVKNLKPGHYALVCALPGHYQAGMYADFTVK